MDSNLKVCPKCERKFADGSAFCVWDGAKLQPKKDFATRLAEAERQVFGKKQPINPAAERKRVALAIEKLKQEKQIKRYADAMKFYCEANPSDAKYCL